MNSDDVATANCRCALGALMRLRKWGLQDAVVSSGARCAPLVWAAARIPGLRVWTHPDERSAAFFALGVAKETGHPAGLICTSGTAGANYYPAIIEAFHSRVPLIVLTADRPPELQGRGAPQTIDQTDLYGRFVKRSVSLPAPGEDHADIATQWQIEATSAYETSMDWPAGPVHLNLPFREPLLPTGDISIDAELIRNDTGQAGESYHAHPAPAADSSHLANLVRLIRDIPRGLLVAGPMTGDAAAAVLRLAGMCGYPLLVDIASQARMHRDVSNAVIAAYDVLLHNPAFRSSMQPNLIIRFGGLPTSKRLNQWLADMSPQAHCLIADSQPVADPFGSATSVITANPARTAEDVMRGLGEYRRERDAYSQLWHSLSRRAWNAVETVLPADTEMFEGRIVADVLKSVNPGTRVVLGNSMPIRWADRYARCRTNDVRVVFNRGANGIDGVVSTAVGVAATAGERVVLVVGDVSFLHDLGGLLPVTQHDANLTIVLLNNDGGGIFSYLPLAAHDQIFESLIAMPHGRTFEPTAGFYGIAYQSVERAEHFVPAFEESLARSGTTLIEVRTNRRRNIELDRMVGDAIRQLELGSDDPHHR